MNRAVCGAENLFLDPIVRALGDFARARDVDLYLVGGSVRDLLMGRSVADMDFAIGQGVIGFAKGFADRVGGTCIVLERSPATARVVVEGSGLHMDFVEFRAGSLVEDLRLRDLTINAMAVAFENVVGFAESRCGGGDLRVIDPCGGLKDLERRLLRFPSKEVVRSDPVRLLRLYRFAAQLNFEMSAGARALVKRYGSQLSEVAGERCRDELMKIFKSERSSPYLREMASVGLLGEVIPALKEGYRCWGALEAFERSPVPVMLQKHRTEIDAYLRTELGGGTDRRSLIKLSLLLGDTPDAVVDHLRFSRKAVRFMACLGSGGRELVGLSGQLTRKEIGDFFRRYVSEWLGVVLYSMAVDSVDLVVVDRVADVYYGDIASIRERGRLITGSDLMREFALEAGEQIGRLLAEVEVRRFAGEVRTREEAFAVVRDLLAPGL